MRPPARFLPVRRAPCPVARYLSPSAPGAIVPAIVLGLVLTVGQLGLAPALLATAGDDLAEADRAEQAGDIERTLTMLRRAAADPASGAGAEALARLCQLSPDAEEAAQAAATLIDQHRQHPAVAVAAEILGHYRAARGEYRTAARLFGTAAMRAQGREPARLMLLRGRALLGAAETGEAREVFAEVMRLPAADAEQTAAAMVGIGDAALLEEDFAGAASTYREYLERFPESREVPIALGQLARALDALEQPAAAVPVFERLVAEFPESTEAAVARDRLRQRARQQEDAPETQPVQATDTPRGHYSLQVGAFGSEENAQELARRLQELGLEEVRIERERRDDGQQFYRVRLGAYRDPEEAEAAGIQLREVHGLASQVVLR